MLALALGAIPGASAPDYNRDASPSVQAPVQYQHDAVAFISFVSPEKLAAICGPRALACVRLSIIYRTNPRDPVGWPRDPLLCHELSHVNSWPADHPQR